jgi:hypothetical protein
MIKSSITKVHPEGSTVHRRDGSVMRVGEEIADGEALTVTLPAGARGATVSIVGPARPELIERLTAPAKFPLEGVPPSNPVTVTDESGALVGTNATARKTASSAIAAAPPALKTTV